jgi:hypothetical protein
MNEENFLENKGFPQSAATHLIRQISTIEGQKSNAGAAE